MTLGEEGKEGSLVVTAAARGTTDPVGFPG